MTQTLAFKPNFLKTAERFEAWWQGEMVDRPPVTLSVKPRRRYTGPISSHASFRERWLDVEFVVESAIAEMERREYVGDSFPCFWPNVGPEISAAVYGCELDFSEDTSWSRPIIYEPDEWQRIIDRPPDLENVYWQKINRMTDYALEESGGRFLVGITDLHGNYDILAALRDPQALCMDLIDCPELVRRAGRTVADAFVKLFERSYQKILSAGLGCTTWCSMYHDGPAYVPSCDFWCLVSTEMAQDLILSDILREMEPLERSIFHLDGPQALKHLHLLLEVPQVNAVQWVYGAGNGPASRWTETYRSILQAGKSIQVIAEDAQDALNVLGELGPHGVWLSVQTEFESVAEGETFLRQVNRVGG